MSPLTRRAFLAAGTAGAVSLLLGACAGDRTASVTALPGPRRDPGFVPDTELVLHAVTDTATILPDTATPVWRIVGEVVEGDPQALTEISGSYLGPTLRLRRGERVRITFRNELSEESILHWHGLDVPADMDGHPRFAIGTGEEFVYEYEVANRAGTYWYHPHPHRRTGPQVYAGMAGLLIVTDDEEQALGLPTGEFDLPLVIQDRSFGPAGELRYLDGGMMGAMMGFLGDRVLVNGRLDARIPVAAAPHRLRLLNGSNSRIYKLAWDSGEPVTVIGTDGGLLAQPVERPYVTLAPAERLDLWVDWSKAPIGAEMRLISLPFRAGGLTSDRFDVLTFQVDRQGPAGSGLTERLSDPGFEAPADADRTRRVELRFAGGTWTLNGRSFEMTDVADDEAVPRGSLEIWEFVNPGRGGMGMGGGMARLPHPMHMHGESFQVVERIVDDGARADWETLADGFVDEGWKDTVLVMPGETVRVLRRFETDGLFLYHCHNLEHEDMGMMRNFEVV